MKVRRTKILPLNEKNLKAVFGKSVEEILMFCISHLEAYSLEDETARKGEDGHS